MNGHVEGALLDGWELTDAPLRLGSAAPIAGVHGVGGTGIGFDDAMLGRHVLFLGGIGTGKTVGMSALVESIRRCVGPDDVVVFFDTKGDYLERFYTDGDVVLSLDGQHPGARQHRWNLFSDLYAADGDFFDENVTELAHTLFAGTSKDAGDNNAIWPRIAADLFSAIITALTRTPARESLSNEDVRWIVDSMTVQDIHNLLEPHADLHGALQYVAKEGSNATVSVLIFLQQAVRSAFIGCYRETGTFSVREFLRSKGGRALFFEYDVASGDTLGPLYRTLLDLALKESLGRSRAAGRVWVVLDEFALLPELTHLDAGLNFGRSLGMRFIVGTQNVGQVRAAYGDDGASSVLSSFGTVFSFRCYDRPSRTFVADRFGVNRQIVRFDSVVKSRGVAEELIEGRVIEDWDISRLGIGEAIAALPDGPPYRFRFAAPGGTP